MWRLNYFIIVKNGLFPGVSAFYGATLAHTLTAGSGYALVIKAVSNCRTADWQTATTKKKLSTATSACRRFTLPNWMDGWMVALNKIVFQFSFPTFINGNCFFGTSEICYAFIVTGSSPRCCWRFYFSFLFFNFWVFCIKMKATARRHCISPINSGDTDNLSNIRNRSNISRFDYAVRG